MERALSIDDRIKRAEEIYYRRREPEEQRRTTRVNVAPEKEFRPFKKMAIQIVFCVLIYAGFSLIQNSNYIFSGEFLNKANEILSYDINVSNFYIQIKEYIDNYTLKNDADKEENKAEEANTVDTDETAIDLGQGGGESNVLAASDTAQEMEVHEEASSYNQMQLDADEAKAKCSFTVPVVGTVSSRFGVRVTDNPIVSKYHSGIDIAANTGTKIISSMDGTVTSAGFESSLGNYIIIKNNDVKTLYAHLSKIYIKSGSSIKQGQEIGEVGSTGNSTGPHLHFQVEFCDRVINPEYILSF